MFLVGHSCFRPKNEFSFMSPYEFACCISSVLWISDLFVHPKLLSCALRSLCCWLNLKRKLRVWCLDSRAVEGHVTNTTRRALRHPDRHIFHLRSSFRYFQLLQIKISVGVCSALLRCLSRVIWMDESYFCSHEVAPTKSFKILSNYHTARIDC